MFTSLYYVDSTVNIPAQPRVLYVGCDWLMRFNICIFVSAFAYLFTVSKT